MKARWLLLMGALAAAAAVGGTVVAQSSLVTATVRPNPLLIEIVSPANAPVGQWFDITADVSNVGGQAVTRVKAVINFPSDFQVRRQRQNIGTLGGHEKATVLWQAQARRAGDFVIQTEATGDVSGEEVTVSDSAVIAAADSFFLTTLRRILLGR